MEYTLFSGGIPQRSLSIYSWPKYGIPGQFIISYGEVSNIIAAIMRKTSGSSLYSDVNGRIFLDEAPEGTEYPYIVFFIIDDSPEKTFTEDFEDYQIQFSIFSDSQSAFEIGIIYTDLMNLFDECSLSITGCNLVWFKAINMVDIQEEHTTPSGTKSVKHRAIDFEGKISLN
jgi:hypothetical protein